ncbi:uncharacterized protein [Gossypium hirsutum]|uniref:Uncharacterized protein isoform X1 n=5 Tax=Gossypium TaxID=3633 RepID=A0A1U8IXJ1_GOSHI|nr:uncharacterized protein LOC107899437 isoform X1 [Gossypium hirsutum]
MHKLTRFRLFILIKGILSRLDIRLSFYIGGEPTSRIAGLFLRILCWNALCSLMISIFKVHQAGLRGDKIDVVVKVQHPGIQDLMMNDIRNLQAFALYIQKNDIKFYLFSATKEMEKQVSVFTLMFLAKHIYHSFMYFSDYVN